MKKPIFFFKHHILPIRLSSCAALLHCWLKRLITTTHLVALSCVSSHLKDLSLGSATNLEEGRSWEDLDQSCVIPCDSFKIPFPFWPSCTVSGPSLCTSASPSLRMPWFSIKHTAREVWTQLSLSAWGEKWSTPTLVLGLPLRPPVPFKKDWMCLISPFPSLALWVTHL